MNKTFKKVLSSVLLICVLASSLALASCTSKPVNYVSDDLSKYVTIDASAYKHFAVSLNTTEVTDEDVQNEIYKLLAKHKETTDPDGNTPSNKIDVTIGVGDLASIFYRGYILEEDGTKNYFDGGSNFCQTIYDLEIGSGAFISGFESGLIGANRKNYAELQMLDSSVTGEAAVVKATDYVKISYSVELYNATPDEDGNIPAKTNQTAYINLADPDLDETWGAGFKAYFLDTERKVNVKFGTKEEPLTVAAPGAPENATNKNNKYYDIRVTNLFRFDEPTEDKPILEVEATFPVNYASKDLAGKEATFEVYVKSVQDYNVPEFNDEFITDKLEVTAEDLANYEGETLAEKYEKKLKEELEGSSEDDKKAAIESAFWSDIEKNAKYNEKKLEKEVEYLYNAHYAAIQTKAGSSDVSNTATSYISSTFGASATTKTWEDVLKTQCENVVKQKLAFYYVIRELNYVPADVTAYWNENIRADLVEQYLTSSDVETTDEDYAEKKAEAEKYIDSLYGSTYKKEQTYLAYGIDKIIENAVVSPKVDSEDK